MGATTRTLMSLEQNPLAKIVVKDVFGFNIPKIATTRTTDERLDVATLEMSNTAITIGSSLLLPPLIRYPAQWVSGVKLSELSGKAAQGIAPKVKLARLGAALGFLFPFASAFWAAVFFRNWLTIKRSNTANFEEIIGLENGKQSRKSGRSLEDELAYQMGMAKKILAIGAGLGALSLIGFGVAARRIGGKSLSKPMDWFFKHFQLHGKGANQVGNGLPTFLFWLAPAYLGWLHAARSKNEFKEQALKAANAILWFSLFTPFGVNPWFKQHFKKLIKENKIPSYREILTQPKYAKLKDTLIHLKNKQFGIGLLITIIMLGVTPQLLNIYLTRKRHERENHDVPVIKMTIPKEVVSGSGALVIRADSPFQVFMAGYGQQKDWLPK